MSCKFIDNLKGIALMKRSEFIDGLREALQSEVNLAEDMALKDIGEWDSLAVIAFIAFCDERFSIQVNGENIQQCKTVSDLIGLVKDHLED
jgi:acyl carrier protein